MNYLDYIRNAKPMASFVVVDDIGIDISAVRLEDSNTVSMEVSTTVAQNVRWLVSNPVHEVALGGLLKINGDK